MKSYKIFRKIFKISTFLCIAFLATNVSAMPYSIEKLPDKTVYNDFVVGPGKYQAELRPGQSKVVNIIVTNRLGVDKTFQIQLEDFTGSRDVNQTVVLLEGEHGPYSLKDYIKIASTTFTLGHAERATIPVNISIPTDASPGGLYGSVVIGTVTTPAEQTLEGESSAGKSPVITRIGSLLFVKVPGDIKEDLVLKSFSLKNKKNIIFETPVDFQILYENNGTIHENPEGSIKVSNIFGSEVADIDVETWFVLPDSLRNRDVSWNPAFLFGRYVATAEIDKGYEGLVDVEEIVFYVIPWKITLLVFLAIVVCVLIVRFVFSKINISLKK